MNSAIAGLRVASVVFGLTCLGHLLRIVSRFDIIIGGHYISRKISAVAVVISGVLCLWLWLLAAKAGGLKPVANETPPAA